MKSQIPGLALRLLLCLSLALPFAAPAFPADNVNVRSIALANQSVLRELKFDGHVWRTARFARADGSDALEVQSDEFHILFLDDSEATIDQYEADGEPERETNDSGEMIRIRYIPRAGASLPPNAPATLTIAYSLGSDSFLRKNIALEMKEGQSVDRLEVERFSVKEPAARGGRGEPVFVNNAWFFGLEYPAFYSRRTDGNTPAAYTGPYDRLGNYSFIDLEGRDVDHHPRAGLIRLMHFPGLAKKQPDGAWGIAGKTAVAGIGRKGETVELAFLDYLDTIRRPVRSFIHYNNWYDKDGKKLTIDNFVNQTFLPFKQNLDPYGVRVDAMVPDDGWQNRQSVYAPNPAQFPRGMEDLKGLSAALRDAGTSMGLWIALNGYNSDIDWGKSQGYAEASPNKHFSRFKRYYAITDLKYNAQLRKQLTDLITLCRIGYIKHDFNEMCDLGEGHGHLATDRHGHEASVDVELELLSLERELNPAIYQNITNWVWFSPWWLMHGNNLWMLANDSGEYRDWPQLSLLVMAAAYRDVQLYRAWSDPAARPLVPISNLMTHGIIYTKSKYAGNGDTLHEFADFVMMYYMRGLQLKEWYINPKILSPQQWEVLGRATRWSEEHLKTLANSVIVGGDPAKNEAYGYVCWNGDEGILSVRNPAPGAAPIEIPFDQNALYRGAAGREFRARVVYPYQADWPEGFQSGAPMRLTVPGDTLLVIHLQPGDKPSASASKLPAVKIGGGGKSGWNGEIAMPDEAMQRCELVVIDHGTSIGLTIDDQLTSPSRTSHGKGWNMASYDLRGRRARTIKLRIDPARKPGDAAWLVMDRPVSDPPADPDPRLPAPVSQGYRRESVQLLGRR